MKLNPNFEETILNACANCGGCCVDICTQQEIKCVYAITDNCCCWTIPVRVAPSQNFVAGTLAAQRTADGLWAPYDPAATDGLQYPRGVFRYSVQTDADGHITNTYSTYGLTSCSTLTTNVYVAGTFYIQETTGNLSAALGHDAFGRVIEGALNATGVWKLL